MRREERHLTQVVLRKGSLSSELAGIHWAKRWVFPKVGLRSPKFGLLNPLPYVACLLRNPNSQLRRTPTRSPTPKGAAQHFWVDHGSPWSCHWSWSSVSLQFCSFAGCSGCGRMGRRCSRPRNAWIAFYNFRDPPGFLPHPLVEYALKEVRLHEEKESLQTRNACRRAWRRWRGGIGKESLQTRNACRNGPLGTKRKSQIPQDVTVDALDGKAHAKLAHDEKVTAPSHTVGMR